MKSFREYLFEQIDDLKVVDLATSKWKSPFGKTGFVKRNEVLTKIIIG
jgi:hypothetical protein